jgi:hypothetical protein
MHPTGGDECAETIAKMEDATARKTSLPSLSESSPDLVEYVPGSDYAEVLCQGQVIAVIPVDEVTAAASVRHVAQAPDGVRQHTSVP